MSTRVLPLLIPPTVTVDGMNAFSEPGQKNLLYTLEPSASPTPQRATFSFWFERTVDDPGPFGDGINYMILSRTIWVCAHNNSGALMMVFVGIDGQGYWAQLITADNIFPYPSGPKHVMIVVDTTQTLVTDRMRLFVDGVEITNFSFDERANINQNDSCGWFGLPGAEGLFLIGDPGGLVGIGPDGIVGDVIGLDGIAVTDATLFTDALYAGPYGARGFHLDMSDPNNFGNDISGNGRHFTSQGLSPADHVDGWITL